MDTIFHEQQEGSLCAQHCLNALIQGQYFSPVDLAEIAQQLDESEREQMAVGGIQTEEYKRFMEQPSNNFDDSGFFSIQVIEKGLSVWGLHLLPYNSQDPIAATARTNPVEMNAYICNFREHWLAIRKLGYQWFNLNSLLTGPELISDTYLSLFLTQLQQEGYSIFIITGNLPECEADSLLKVIPANQPIKPKLINEKNIKKKVTDSDVKQALEASKQDIDADDKILQETLKKSMEGYFYDETLPNSSSNSTGAKETEDKPIVTPSHEEIRSKRLAFLSKLESSSSDKPDANQTDSEKCNGCDVLQKEQKLNGPETSDEGNDEDMLKQAIAMSMEGLG
ncbi:ATXN3 [Mytilus edulis]|uniref:Ataxin-3 homolog n=1 Tax=Mytilus edulis TaxID=6550 RepID=A0A8S3VRB2_MYTED|nr:ATXN3 [Mytilus edulis]